MLRYLTQRCIYAAQVVLVVTLLFDLKGHDDVGHTSCSRFFVVRVTDYILHICCYYASCNDRRGRRKKSHVDR